MLRKKPPKPAPQPDLTLSRKEAAEHLLQRVEIGRELEQRDIKSGAELEVAKSDRRKWDDFNLEMLKRIFSTEVLAEEYKYSHTHRSLSIRPGPVPLSKRVISFKETAGDKISSLESIIERLELIPEPGTVPAVEAPIVAGDEVFIVHGHDEAITQPNQGLTIIEKFEEHSAVGFAIIVLTADDLGHGKNEPEVRARARQNVIFELGFFCGALGRSRVCPLYEEVVELPSDFHGVAYIPLDEGGAWKYRLAKELQEAGFVVDLNRV